MFNHAEMQGFDVVEYRRNLGMIHLASPQPQLIPLMNHPQDAHVIPDSQEHRSVAQCWCGPTPGHPWGNDGRIFIHHERDQQGN